MNVRQHAQSLVKAITWRVIGTTELFVVSILVTGHASTAASVTGIAAVSSTLLYYVHERLYALPILQRLFGHH